MVSWFATVRGEDALLVLLEPVVDAREAEAWEEGTEEAVLMVGGEGCGEWRSLMGS